MYHPRVTAGTDKREVLQSIVDRIDPAWEIIKPAPNNPEDPDILCIFRKDWERQKVEIPIAWYQDPSGREKIEGILRDLLK